MWENRKRAAEQKYLSQRLPVVSDLICQPLVGPILELMLFALNKILDALRRK